MGASDGSEPGLVMRETGQRYKDYVSGLYDRAAPLYDRQGPTYFSHLGRRLVELSGLQEGSSVLDVGCGRGACLLPAAERVGSSGNVFGVDLSGAMVKETASEIKCLRHANAEALLADAEALPFANSCFDYVFCAFALFLLPDLDRALAGFQHVLKSRGRLLVSTFGKQLDERWDAYRSLVRTFRDHLQPVPEASTPALFGKTRLESILSSSGLVDVRVLGETREFHYDDAEAWWASEWSCGNRALFERLEPAALERFRDQAIETVRGIKREGGVPIRLHVLLASARKP